MIFLFLYILPLSILCKNDPLEIFYINLNSSTLRNIAMRKHLDDMEYPYQRVEAVQIPSNINYNLTQALHPCHEKNLPFYIPNTPYMHYKSINIKKLCISPENEIKEIAVTLSHLKALYMMIQSSNDHPYALVLEDDVVFPFIIDFAKMSEVFPRRNKFGFLQLFVSNHKEVPKLLEIYTAHNLLFVHHFAGFWCAGAYLVNKAMIRNTLSGFFKLFQRPGDVFVIDLIAGSNRLPDLSSSCFPPQCCDGNRFIRRFPCVLSKSIAADHYIFNTAGTYTATLPLFRGNSVSSTISTFSASHAFAYKKGLSLVAEIISKLYDGTYILPPYLSLLNSSKDPS